MTVRTVPKITESEVNGVEIKNVKELRELLERYHDDTPVEIGLYVDYGNDYVGTDCEATLYIGDDPVMRISAY